MRPGCRRRQTDDRHDHPQPLSRRRHPNISLPDFVFADAARRADKPALIDGPSGRAITYGELVGGARLVAGGLAARGFRRGEVFAIYSPTCPSTRSRTTGCCWPAGPPPPSTPCTPSRNSPPSSRRRRQLPAHLPPFLDKAIEAAGRSGVREVFVLGEAEGATPFAALLRAATNRPR